MTNYELNKIVHAQLPNLSIEDINEYYKPTLIKWLKEQRSANKHFLLLCKDINYYTIFSKNFSKHITDNFDEMANDIFSCLSDISVAVKDVEYFEDQPVCSFWIETEDQEIMMVAFIPCEDFVVEF